MRTSACLADSRLRASTVMIGMCAEMARASRISSVPNCWASSNWLIATMNGSCLASK